MVQAGKQHRHHWLVWVLSFIVLVLLGIVAFWWWYTSAPPTANANTPICSASDLKLHVGNTDNTAGTAYTTITVTNDGKQMCSVTGYPSVSLLDNKGARLGNDSQQNNLYNAVTIALKPGMRANVSVGLPDANNFDPGICSDTSTTLRMYLPGVGVSAPLTVPFAQKNCPGFSATAFYK